MPTPIKPLHEQEDLSNLFAHERESSQGLSELQLVFLGEPVREAARKVPEDLVKLLDKIYKSQDDVLTAAAMSTTKTASREAAEDLKVFRVPRDISDGQLLGLKTNGLVSGSGRAVTLTSLGKKALRDAWLTNGNNLKSTRKKTKFDVQAAREELHARNANTTNSAFVRVIP